MKNNIEKITFRKEKDNNIIAVYPKIKERRGFKLIYAHMGQHSNASIDYLKHDTKKAKTTEYIDLLKELSSIYYDISFQVVSRMDLTC